MAEILIFNILKKYMTKTDNKANKRRMLINNKNNGTMINKFIITLNNLNEHNIISKEITVPIGKQMVNKNNINILRK